MSSAQAGPSLLPEAKKAADSKAASLNTDRRITRFEHVKKLNTMICAATTSASPIGSSFPSTSS